jgi:hypothetical protein
MSFLTAPGEADSSKPDRQPRGEEGGQLGRLVVVTRLSQEGLAGLRGFRSRGARGWPCMQQSVRCRSKQKTAGALWPQQLSSAWQAVSSWQSVGCIRNRLGESGSLLEGCLTMFWLTKPGMIVGSCSIPLTNEAWMATNSPKLLLLLSYPPSKPPSFFTTPYLCLILIFHQFPSSIPNINTVHTR